MPKMKTNRGAAKRFKLKKMQSNVALRLRIIS